MKDSYIYASAIVLSALILGFFYALAHHYECIPSYDSCGNYRGRTYSTWTGEALKVMRYPATAPQGVTRP